MKLKKTKTEIKSQKAYNNWVEKSKPKSKNIKKCIWDKLLKGCKSKDYKTFLESKYWQKIQKIILKRDNYKCTVCENNKTLQVHHSTYKHHFAEHKHLEILLTLCEKCHYEYHLIKDVI